MAERSGIDVNLAASMLEDARAAVDQLRSSQSREDTGHDEEAAEAGEGIVGEGRDSSGQIRAQVGANGRLTAVDIRQRAIREGSQRLGPMVAEAINAAREDRRAKTAEQSSGRLPSWDPGALIALQRDSAMRATALVEQFSEAMNKVARAAGTAEE